MAASYGLGASEVLKVCLDHGSCNSACFHQFDFGSISERPSILAAMPSLPQRLVVTERPETRPLRPADTKRRSRGCVITKLRGERVANLVKVHKFVIGIADCRRVAPKQRGQERIVGTVGRDQLREALFLVNTISL